jgi:predicted PurR-regulated permease PerM
MSFPSPSKKQARVLWFSLTALALAILLALLGVLLWATGWVLHRLSAVLVPMAFALILAYILDPVVEFFVKKKMPRMWAVCLVMVLGIVVIGALLGSVLPGLQRETRRLSDDLPKNVEYVRSKAAHYVQELPPSWRTAFFPVEQPQTNANGTVPATNRLPTNLAEVATNIVIAIVAGGTNTAPTTNTEAFKVSAHDVNRALNAPIGKTVIPGVTRALVFVAGWFQEQLGKVTTWVEFLVGFVLVPVYLFYFLLEKNEITDKWTDYLPIKESPAKEETVFVLRAINECMIVFFRGQVLVALCVGILLTAAYLTVGLNYAVILGIVAGVLEIVPYLGTIVGLVLALAVSAIQFKDWTHPLIVLGIVVTIKLLEDFVIAPKIIGERVGLHPLTIIVAVMVGTTLLGGFTGALLAIPLTAALRTLMFRYIWNKGRDGEKQSDPEALTE